MVVEPDEPGPLQATIMSQQPKLHILCKATYTAHTSLYPSTCTSGLVAGDLTYHRCTCTRLIMYIQEYIPIALCRHLGPEESTELSHCLPSSTVCALLSSPAIVSRRYICCTCVHGPSSVPFFLCTCRSQSSVQEMYQLLQVGHICHTWFLSLTTLVLT